LSGFAGILNLDGTPVDRRLLERMTHSLAFRGPDAEEIWCAGSAGLGHALLRTTEESVRERQPFALDGRLWIAADARIDARPELIEKLRANRGASNAVSLSTPDAELILHAYDTWGDACVKHLLGDFSFAVWDASKRRLFCARDHFGVKLLYHARIGSTLIFSNTMDALRVHPGITAKLSDAYVGDYLLIGCDMHPTLTPFEQIERLPPAHTLTASQEQVRFARYWSFPIEEPLRYRRSREYVDEFHGLLSKAVGDRLRTDRASISLSGGLDSTTVAAEAARQLSVPERLLGATYGFNRVIRDPEPPLARVVADYLGMSFHYLAADDYGLFDRCDSLASRFPWPTDLALAASVCDLFDVVAGHGRLLLTGQGGDFGIAPSLAVHRGARVFRLLWDVGKYILAHGYAPRIGFRVTWQRWRGTSPKEVPPYPQWFEPEFESRTNLRDRYRELAREPPPAHPFRPDSYSSLISPFVSSVFENYDAGYWRLPLEVRHPLFDLRIQRFFLRLPMLPWCADKELLRVAMRGRLPVEILRRPKTPVEANPLWRMLQEAGAYRLDNFPQASAFEYYVVRDKIKTAQKEGDVKNLESCLRALSLNYWLQSNQPIR
jgi:asparagine synthase (glutamine-hydrolysing)